MDIKRGAKCMAVEIFIPSLHGKDCPSDGHHFDENGNEIECCCDECDYYLKCFPEYLQFIYDTFK